MKATIKVQISKTGEVKVLTVQGVGGNCRMVVDDLTKVLGRPDESTRADTDDLYVQGDQDLTATV